MSSRHSKDDGWTSLPAVSRRAVIGGGSAATAAPRASAAARLAAISAASTDPAKPYKAWLYIDAKISRLRRRWARLEAYLSNETRAIRPSAGPNSLPRALELRDIDGMMDLLSERRAALFEALPVRGAATLEELIARLAVAERLIWNDNHMEASAMICGTRQDLVSWLERGRLPGR